MKRLWIGVASLFICACMSSAGAQTQEVSRNTGETDISFVTRVLHLSKDADPHVTTATWDGHATLFVDYETDGNDPERPTVALQEQASGGYRTLQVTVGEEEGGVPDVVAIGFAKVTHDHGTALIVILSWAQQHAAVSGTLYEVRIFAEPKPGQTSLELLKVSDKFGAGCDCSWDDGTSKHYRFKTIAAVQAELKRLRY